MANDAVLEPDPDIAREVAASLLVHCFPLMLTDVVRAHHPMGFPQFHLLTEEAETLAPGLADNDSRIVLASAWLDLTDGPVVLHLPHMGGRFFNLTLTDTAGQVFASLGARTGDDTGVSLALAPPNWDGKLPNGLRAARATGNHAWAVSRIRARSNLDLSDALGVAKRQRVTVLHADLDKPRRPMSTLETPCPSCLRQAAEIGPALLFHRLDVSLARAPIWFRETAEPAVSALRAKIGGPPPSATWSPEFGRALARGFADGIAAIQAVAEAAWRAQQGWRTLPGGADHAASGVFSRAARAYSSLGAPLREDLLSLVCDRDASGLPLSGDHGYRIRFAKGALPPVQSLWWLSAQPAAPLDQRRGIGDLGEPKINPDGSLDVFIQRTLPGDDLALNWLPIPAGRFSLDMRLFTPRPQALTGAWRMPPVERLEARFGSDHNLEGTPVAAGRPPPAYPTKEANPPLPIGRTP